MSDFDFWKGLKAYCPGCAQWCGPGQRCGCAVNAQDIDEEVMAGPIECGVCHRRFDDYGRCACREYDKDAAWEQDHERDEGEIAP